MDRWDQDRPSWLGDPDGWVDDPELQMERDLAQFDRFMQEHPILAWSFLLWLLPITLLLCVQDLLKRWTAAAWKVRQR